MTHSKDLFFHFIDQYEKGHILNALQSIVSSPNVVYDHLISQEKIFKHLVNFIDACLFETFEIVTEAYDALEYVINEDQKLSVSLNEFIERIRNERKFLEIFAFIDKLDEVEQANPFSLFSDLKNKKLLSAEQINSSIDQYIPAAFREFVSKKSHILNHWNRLIEHKPYMELILAEKRSIFYALAWHVFVYPSAISLSISKVRETKTPIIFLEPIESFDYQALFSPYVDRSCIIVVDTLVNFLHLMQFSEFLDALCDPLHILYILELYPQKQIALKNISNKPLLPLEPILITSNHELEERIPLFLQAFTQCFNQSVEELNADTPIANWLYKLSQRTNLSRNVNKYGKSRIVGLTLKEDYRLWFDPHKGLPPLLADLGPSPKDYLGEILQELSVKRIPRAFMPHKKIRLAHVVAQVENLNHAPTKLTTNLLRFADRNWFETFLISTDRMVLHLLDYPIPQYSMSPSYERGANVLEYLNMLGVKIHIEPLHLTYEQTAEKITKLLTDLKIDVVVFHGSDPVNLLISSSTDVPFRIFFEHGTLPEYPNFDLAILSNEENYRQYKDVYKKEGMESCFLNYAINVREKWEPNPYSKEQLGFPSDSILMTTISNHLENRISIDMCHAIGEILSRCPQAYYTPIGHINNPKQFEDVFEQYQVRGRVKFLGAMGNPSQLVRTMDLYLNEFPFGSGLGIIEAMAAGCPIVSMYDEKGVAQAKYGGVYFGKDWVIQSCDKKEYVELACRLITDPSFYEKWAKHAEEEYLKRANEKEYVKSFEHLLSEFINLSGRFSY